MLKPPPPNINKALYMFITGGFLFIGLMQYIAYYFGLSLVIADYQHMLTHWYVFLFVLVSYMFRLDILAAGFGFYGAWKVGHVEMWEAAVFSAVFLFASLFLNHGAGAKWMNAKALRRPMTEEEMHVTPLHRATSAVAATTTGGPSTVAPAVLPADQTGKEAQ